MLVDFRKLSKSQLDEFNEAFDAYAHAAGYEDWYKDTTYGAPWVWLNPVEELDGTTPAEWAKAWFKKNEATIREEAECAKTTRNAEIL